MQDILNDIELDFYELKCFLEFVEKNPHDKKLQEVAFRALKNLSFRVDSLKSDFAEKYLGDKEHISTVSQIASQQSLNTEPTSVSEVEDNVYLSVLSSIDNATTPTVENHEEVTEEVVTEDIVTEEVTVEELPSEMPDLPLEETSKTTLPKDETKTVSSTPSTKELGSLYKALTLNDVFYFTRELFNNNSVTLKDEMRKLEQCKDYKEAYKYTIQYISDDIESESFKSFDEFLKKHFI